MTLENANVIDIITTPEPGKLELVISDGGVTTDPLERLNLLIAKLKSYVGYILSEQFAEDHPDLGPEDVSIAVVCANPPTSEMLGISHVRPHVQPERLIPVKFLLFRNGEFTPINTERPTRADRDRVRPRLITAEFLARASSRAEIPHRPLGDTGLFVAYVVDGENTVAYVMGDVVEELGLSEEELYELATRNLAKTFDAPALVRNVMEKPSITTVKCLDTYDAARVLLIPSGLRPGEALAALIPDRDTLTLMAIPEGGNWTPLAELAKVPASDHLLLNRPLRVTGDGFEVM